MAQQTVYSGIRESITAQAQLIPDQVVQNKIDLLTSNKAPWTLLTRSGKARPKKPVGSWTYYIYQDLLIKAHTTLAAAAAVGATTWNVATGTGAYISGWDVLWNRTRNVFVHAQTVSTDAVTVVANVDGGTDTAGQVGDEIIILGNATQEAGGIVQAKTIQETKRTNYVEDTMTSWHFSDMALNSDSFFTQKDPSYQRMKIMIEHQRKLERKYKFNGLAKLLSTATSTYTNPSATSTSRKTGFTMGFINGFMRTYADADHWQTQDDLTENEIIDQLEYVFYAENEGQNKKTVVWWVPPKLLTAMTKWNIGRNQYTDRESKKNATLGLKFREWVSPFGIINIITDHELGSTVSGGRNFYCFMDLSRVATIPYAGLDTHIKIHKSTYSAPKETIGYIRTVDGTYFTQENAHLVGSFITTS